MTTDQGRELLAGWRDEQFASFVTVVLGLAAQKHPEELRKALGSVFDLKQIEGRYEIMKLTLSNLAVTASEIRELFHALSRDIDHLEVRLDRLAEAEERKERGPT